MDQDLHIKTAFDRPLDNTFFEEELKRYQPDIYRWAYKLMRKNKEDAEDLLQSVLCRAWEKKDTYDPAKGSVRVWAFKIAQSLHIDQFRASSCTTRKGNTYDYYRRHGGTNTDPVPAIDAHNILHFIRNHPAINQEKAELFILNQFEGFTHEQIAEHKNIPVGTVKTRIKDVRVSMQKILEQDEFAFDFSKLPPYEKTKKTNPELDW
jgi:RNA polymerase sigma-70 factor, ECF subfamily